MAKMTVTDREWEIIQLLAEGMSNEEIAKNAYLSLSRVKNTITELNKKLGTQNRTEIVVMYYKGKIERQDAKVIEGEQIEA